jgi:tRNA (uracil-5-)-methyltransferase
MLGTPFVPVKALAVDMFPHTEHCEVVILFERQKEDAANNTNSVPNN